MSHFTGQHFAILGAGRSGLGAARLARLHGAEVTVFDEGDPQKMAAAISKLEAENFRSVTGEAAKQMQVKAGDFQLVIVSPGIDESWPLPQKFTQAGVPLVGETELHLL
jgi:UDP-N-acetylmuramoylalanine--D-glutamate ligase